MAKRKCACECELGKRRRTCTHKFTVVRCRTAPGLRVLYCETCDMSEYEHDWVMINRGNRKDG